jgi:hypothetical protein
LLVPALAATLSIEKLTYVATASSCNTASKIRYDIGLGKDFFELLMKAAIEESAAAIERKPLPYVLERHGLRIVFKDIWSSFEDGVS